MATVYRLVKAKYADTALDGSGASRNGGRWNSRGVPVLYTSDSLALAALELLLFHPRRTTLRGAYTLWTLEVPEDAIRFVPAGSLPVEWRASPPPVSTVAIGDEWAMASSSLALAVPSTVVTIQNNVLINPAHREFDALLKTARRVPFAFDARLA